MISNGDDTGGKISFGQNTRTDPAYFSSELSKFQAFTSKYAKNSLEQNLMNAQSFRFISLVAYNSCSSDWVHGQQYIKLSESLYNYQGFSNYTSDDANDPDTKKDSVNLCSGNYEKIFTAVNESISAVIDGHKYDHWKISSASESAIQVDDITLTKIDANGVKTIVPKDKINGFEYIGHKVDQKIAYEPVDSQEKVTGLVVKLNGNARIEYPECLIAKTRTPTEYFGYFVFPREPDTTTIKVQIDGKEIPQSEKDGWTYLNWQVDINMKVPGPTKASVTPALRKTGYFIKLNGNAIYTNGQSISVYYKPKGK